MTQVCRQCSRINPPEASYCYHDGVLLGGHSANGGPLNAGAAPFPSQFVFPNGLMCRNFDQLAMSCQEHWSAAADLLRQGFLSTFLGGMGRADLAIAANEAAQFPDRDRGLDQLLAKLPTHVLQAPKLKVEPSDINLGQLALGADLEIEFHLGNQGMRLLYGSVVSDCKWLSFGEGPGASQKLFQFGADAVLAVRVRGKHLRGGNKPMEGRLIFDSNGGSIIVAVRAYVPIAPFTEGVLAGSTTPRQIAEKAKAAPKEAAALFEKGAVANWFQRNGWSYPVQGPSVGGIGGVQQFFEALGLAKPPKLEMKTTALALKGEVGQPLQTSLEVTTRDNKVLYAHATCDQLWVDVSKVKLSGRNAVITVSVPSVPDRPGETLQARITVYGNGNQRFVAALAVEVEGNPFADFGASAPGAAPVPVAKLIEERAAAPRMVDAAQSPAAIPLLPAEPVAEPLADPANPFAVIPFSVTGSVGVSTPLSASAEHVRAPADHAVDALDPRARRPFWQHLIPLALLAAALLGVMIRDLACKPSRAVSEGEIDHTQRLVVRFDFGPKTNQSASFGLVMLDSAKDEKKLTFDPSGTSNSTVVTIDGKTAIFGPAFGRTASGVWEKKPNSAAALKSGTPVTWLFHLGRIATTQTVEIAPGAPVEVTPENFKRLMDTCVIRYKLENRDTRPHTVGIRILIDTMIGDNDGAPFTIPGVPGLVSTCKNMIDTEIPDFIQAQESSKLDKPGIVVQMNMRLGGRIEPPSGVSLTQWPDRPGLWEYKVPLKDIGNDSCIVLYWNPAELAPGVSREVGFSYGLGDVTSKGKLGILNPPPIAVGETFTLVALVADAKPGQSATLELPAGFDLAPDILRTQEVPPSKGGQPSPVTWRVAASSEPGDYLFTVNTSDGMSHSRRVTVRSRGIFQ